MLYDYKGNLIKRIETSPYAVSLGSAFATQQGILREGLASYLDDNKIREAKEAAHLGAPLEYYRILEQLCYTDGHTAGLLDAMYERIIGHTTIIASRDTNNTTANTIASLISELLYDSMHMLKATLAESTFYGISVIEQTLIPVDDMFIRQKIASVSHISQPYTIKFTPLPQLFLRDVNGELQFIQPNGAINFNHFLPDKFIIAFRPQDQKNCIKKPLPFDELGIQRRLFRPLVDKIYAILGRRTFDDLFTDPVLDLAYEPEKDAISDASAIYNIYTAGGRLRALKHTKSLSVQFLQSQDATVSQNLTARIEADNAEITKAINGDNLGTESISNRASSVQGYNKLLNRDRAVIQWIDSIINTKVIPLLMKTNFPNMLHLTPYAQTIVREEKNISQELDVIRVFFEHGGVMTRKEFDERLGYETPKGEENKLLASPNRIIAEDTIESEDTQAQDEKQIQSPTNQPFDPSLIDYAEGFIAPKSAQQNARQVLEWQEKYPNEIKGLSSVIWKRASQIASAKPISIKTIKQMADFAKHHDKSILKAKFKLTPWKQASFVAWLGNGGDEGIAWAKQILSNQPQP